MVFNPIWIPRFTQFVSHGNLNRTSAEPTVMVRHNIHSTNKGYFYLYAFALIFASKGCPIPYLNVRRMFHSMFQLSAMKLNFWDCSNK